MAVLGEHNRNLVLWDSAKSISTGDLVGGGEVWVCGCVSVRMISRFLMGILEGESNAGGPGTDRHGLL